MTETPRIDAEEAARLIEAAYASNIDEYGVSANASFIAVHLTGVADHLVSLGQKLDLRQEQTAQLRTIVKDMDVVVRKLQKLMKTLGLADEPVTTDAPLRKFSLRTNLSPTAKEDKPDES